MIIINKNNAFQSTLPRGERPGAVGAVKDLAEFQSTLPRGERPLPIKTDGLSYRISIHAPARGATEERV